MKNKIYVFIAIIFITFSVSCDSFYHQDPIPSYIHIENIKLTVTDSSSTGQGTASSKITDAWTYIDGQLVGCFQMPCTFPVLWSGAHTITIRPGIKVNGIAADRAPYPFYYNYTHSINLTQGATTNVSNVSVTYLPSTVIQFKIEDFEGQGSILDTTNASSTKLIVTNAYSGNTYPGNHYAYAYLYPSPYPYFECATSADPNNLLSLPAGGADVFLELNYKCNQPFMVNMVGYTTQTGTAGTTITNTAGPVQAITVNISQNWNKIYIYLTPAIAQLSGANEYRIFFDMNNLYSLDSVGFAIDNIKIIH